MKEAIIEIKKIFAKVLEEELNLKDTLALRVEENT